ncbi:MAG: hypothetical protein GX774_09145 [Armatimonadetes bacterium]|nr:hypothetical protein [Armatimonadota bacterium]
MRNWAALKVALAVLPAFGCLVAANTREAATGDPAMEAKIEVVDFLAERSLARAGRPVGLAASVINRSETDAVLKVTLDLPNGLRAASAPPELSFRLTAGAAKELRWRVRADAPLYDDLRLRVSTAGQVVAEASLPMRFLPPVSVPKGYIPEPKPAQTPILIGAHHCPLWEADRPEMWTQIRKHPERLPALGFYAQENPEVADWETKWAVEHGISFFIYCWYRASQGEPVKMNFGSAIHQALFHSRYQEKLKFTLMWENQARGTAGVADENDLLQNLLPFWIREYFRHPSYLKVDNRPVLFIYRPEFLIDDLGGEANVVRAFDKMRQACRDAGFAGLYILGEYRGLDANHLRQMQRLGLDYTFAYCWHISDNPTPARAIATQMDYLRQTQALAILPQVVTVSQGWSGWHDEGSIWQIPPREYEELLRQAKQFITTLPPGELGSRMLLLDNWNEWGEGHYLAPHTEHGFGYLDAVRRVFAPDAGPHTDLLPEDLGLGPYDRPYREHLVHERNLRRLLSRRVTKPGAPRGLLGWWAFDEEGPVALDYSGHRLGGELRDARRVPGWEGSALECRGGCVVVPNHPRLSPTAGLTIECWVKSDQPGQENTWIVNRVLAGSTDTGYRLGVLGGKPCFEVPQTDWSHHLTATADLPTGRWVHLAGTFDGQQMRLYVDGKLDGVMDRPGPVKPNNLPLHLGSYEAKHQAHFVGLLDEVRLYDRALTAAEVARLAAAGTSPGMGLQPR